MGRRGMQVFLTLDAGHLTLGPKAIWETWAERQLTYHASRVKYLKYMYRIDIDGRVHLGANGFLGTQTREQSL